MITLASIPLWIKIFDDEYHFKHTIIALACTLVSMFAGIYFIISLLLFIFRASVEDHMRTYRKGVVASYILSDTTGKLNLTYDDMNIYSEDIIIANDMIRTSRELKDNWYLKDFYYDEIAELPYIEKKIINS